MDRWVLTKQDSSIHTRVDIIFSSKESRKEEEREPCFAMSITINETEKVIAIPATFPPLTPNGKKKSNIPHSTTLGDADMFLPREDNESVTYFLTYYYLLHVCNGK